MPDVAAAGPAADWRWGDIGEPEQAAELCAGASVVSTLVAGVVAPAPRRSRT